MLIEELRSFKEKVSQKAENEIFLASFGGEDCSCCEVKWSRGVGFSFIPYELEMSGVKPGRFLNKEPDKKIILINTAISMVPLRKYAAMMKAVSSMRLNGFYMMKK